MNAFDEMAMQFQLETLVEELDTEYDQVIDTRKAEEVITLLNNALELLEQGVGKEQHPIEFGTAQLIRAAYTIYLLASMGNPNVVAVMAKDLVLAAIDFNDSVHPLLLTMYKKANGEKYESG